VMTQPGLHIFYKFLQLRIAQFSRRLLLKAKSASISK